MEHDMNDIDEFVSKIYGKRTRRLLYCILYWTIIINVQWFILKSNPYSTIGPNCVLRIKDAHVVYREQMHHQLFEDFRMYTLSVDAFSFSFEYYGKYDNRPLRHNNASEESLWTVRANMLFGEEHWSERFRVPAHNEQPASA